jgi:hypothetical protein
MRESRNAMSPDQRAAGIAPRPRADGSPSRPHRSDRSSRGPVGDPPDDLCRSWTKPASPGLDWPGMDDAWVARAPRALTSNRQTGPAQTGASPRPRLSDRSAHRLAAQGRCPSRSLQSQASSGQRRVSCLPDLRGSDGSHESEGAPVGPTHCGSPNGKSKTDVAKETAP